MPEELALGCQVAETMDWTLNLTSLKRLALPAELLAARPKRLRFLICKTAGRLVHHARRVVLRLAPRAERLGEWLEAMRLLPVRVGIVFGNSLSTDLETSFWREAGGSVFLIGK